MSVGPLSEQSIKATVIHIKDKNSLIHLGSLDSFDITTGGKEAAGEILKYLEEDKDKAHLEKAIEIYEQIIPNENFGGEYTALAWICRYFLADEDVKKEQKNEPSIRAFLRMMMKDDSDNLRTYLKYKYHILSYGKGDQTELRVRMRFLEDYILFSNPDRERWEAVREYINRFHLEKGMHIADVGCGPGYYSFRFSRIVGDEGKVYAIETSPLHLEYLNEYVEENHIGNVEVVKSNFEGIGLPADIRVDVVYICSLYHNVYAAFTDAERDSFVKSIRRALKKDGRLIIVDNDLVAEEELPYHGPYVAKELLISQLYYYGFHLEDVFQIMEQRYVLIFSMMEEIPETNFEASSDTSIRMSLKDTNPESIFVPSAASLVRYRIIGTSMSGYTLRGKKCGRLMYEGLISLEREKLEEAYKAFETLYPLERVGDDYTALMWFIRYILAGEEERKGMTADPLTAFYCRYFCEDDFSRLKNYLLYKFHLELPDPEDGNIDKNYEYDGKDFSITTLNAWNEFLVFNNPNRALWEKTEKLIDFLGIKKGEKVADVGCGGGLFSWRFSCLVGEEGRVYSTEINESALSYLKDFCEEYNVSNIETRIASLDNACLPENGIDLAFMASMYHAVYITDIEFVKDAFVDSLRRALKENGRLVILDNSITEPPVPSYYGPGILPELIIAQLSKYGFILEEGSYLIPQRYMLMFRKDPAYIPPKKKESVKKKNAQAEIRKLLR